MKKHAVVIGINGYVDGAHINPLRYAEQDAEALHDFLQQRCGFSVMKLIGAEATRCRISDSVSDQCRDLGPDDLFVFYFAGQGYDDKRGYLLLAADVRCRELPSGMAPEVVPVRGLEKMTSSQGFTRLLILDACRSPLEKGGAKPAVFSAASARDLQSVAMSSYPALPPAGLDVNQLNGIQKEILNLGHHAIQPQYHPIVVPEILDGKHVLILWCPGGPTRPYKVKLGLGKDCKEWGYFIRKGSSTVRAKGPDETELLSLAATIPYDDQINQRATLDDLSRDLILAFLKEVDSPLAGPAKKLAMAELGRQMNIVDGPKEALFPKNVGLLFFNPEPERFFPATQIDVVWFPEGAGGNRFTEKTFKGPLARLTREALDYIRRNYISETVIKHPDRAEATRVENFPYAAIEEAVVNAAYHRGYDVREPVEVRISKDELVILSYPGPDRSVRLQDLRAGRALPRRYRNRRIGEFLKELDLTEGRSTGIPKIMHAMESNGSPPPIFDFDEDHSFFMVRLPVQPQATMPEGLTRQVPDKQPTSRNKGGGVHGRAS